MKYKAFAKINLRLNVLGKNEFNYHNLSMLNAKISLFDELEIIESTNNKVEYSVDGLNNSFSKLMKFTTSHWKNNPYFSDNWFIVL